MCPWGRNAFDLTCARPVIVKTHIDSALICPTLVLVSAQLEVRRATKPSAPDDQSGRIEGSVVDISQHKRADEALRDSQERLLGIISSAMDAIITADGDQKIIVFNGAAEQSSAAQRKRHLGRLSTGSFHKDSVRLTGNTFEASGKLASPVARCTRREH